MQRHYLKYMLGVFAVALAIYQILKVTTNGCEESAATYQGGIVTQLARSLMSQENWASTALKALNGRVVCVNGINE